MSRRAWFIVAILFSLVNLFGEVYAALHWELIHGAIHALLLLVGVYVVWRLAPRREPSY